jgi:hypothetical protein
MDRLRAYTPMELALELASWFRTAKPQPGRAEFPAPLDIAADLRDVPRKGRGAAVGTRPWSRIVGITLHQTATRDFAPSHAGLDDVPAHAMVHRDGRVSLLHHPTAYVQHGHALNGGTIGIEIACRAAGTEGDASTFWRSAEEKDGWERDKNGKKTGRFLGIKTYAELVREATDIQLAAARDLCRYYFDLVADNGGKVRGIWGHNQGHSSRTSDPGSRIWRQVAEPLRVELELKDVRDMTLGSGTTVPKAWRA